MTTRNYQPPPVTAEARLAAVEKAIPLRARRAGGASAAALTAATSATPLLLVHKRRRYRISGVIFCTTGGDAGVTVTLNAVYTDRVGAVTEAITAAQSLNATGRKAGHLVIEAENATSISYSTTIAGGARAVSVHALEVELEELP